MNTLQNGDENHTCTNSTERAINDYSGSKSTHLTEDAAVVVLKDLVVGERKH